jgi:hypothetical protein
LAGGSKSLWHPVKKLVRQVESGGMGHWWYHSWKSP